jgi:hypothetical protein
VWSPFTWLVGYVDPRKPSNDVLHGEAAMKPAHGPACTCCPRQEVLTRCAGLVATLHIPIVSH